MLASSRIPIVFLACANSYRKGKRLRYLVNERKAISRILSSDKHSVYQPVEKGNVANEFFLSLLRKRQYRDRVSVLHFVGHADMSYFRLESDEFETPLSIDQLSELVAQLPNLKAVFLSGCATPRILEMLLERDVPAVIVTQSRAKDARTTAIAKTFYNLLSEGKTLKEVFEELTAQHADMRPVEVTYDVESDDLHWEGKELLFNGLRLPWGMYYLSDNAEKLTEGANRRPILFQPSRTKKFKRFRRLIGVAAAVLALVGLAVGLTLLMQQPDDIVSWVAAF